MTRPRSLVPLFALVALVMVATLPPAGAQPGGTSAPQGPPVAAEGDFNGDGFSDLVATAALEDVSGQVDAGAVNVLYGSAAGVTDAGNQFWHQDSEGILDQAEPDEFFGQSVAAGDFNGDGYSDAAIGVVEEGVDAVGDAGAVAVIYGSATGLTPAGNQLWTQNSPDIRGVAEPFDLFGFSVATGDFNGDLYADLAIGVPGERVGGLDAAGGVSVLYGSRNGLSARRDDLWTQASDPTDVPEGGDFYGFAVAAGDFNGDSRDDLAVGVPYEDLATGADAGGVNVIYGASLGLSSTGSQFWSQNTNGVPDASEEGDLFGFDVVGGDFGKGPEDDLAIGAPFEDLPAPRSAAGGVNVLYGTPIRLRAAGSQFWTQDSEGVESRAFRDEVFGNALAKGDFGNGPRIDLAIAVAFDDVEGVDSAGAVNVLYGSDAGLTAAGNQIWHQNSPGVPNDAEVFDVFGFDAWAADFGGDPQFDLVAGVALEDLARRQDVGAVNVIYGSPKGLTGVGSQYWTQNVGAVADTAETGDLLGFAVA